MTASTGFRRLGFILLAAFVAGASALMTAGYLVSAETVRQQALNEIRAVTGLDPILRGEASVSMFPTGRVSFAALWISSLNWFRLMIWCLGCGRFLS